VRPRFEIKTTPLRLTTAGVAVVGILSVIVFAYCYSGSLRGWWSLNFTLAVFGPYLGVAVAAALSRTKGVAIFTLTIALTIFALGLNMYLSYARSGPDTINDGYHVTIPMQRFLAYAALAVAISGFLLGLFDGKEKDN